MRAVLAIAVGSFGAGVTLLVYIKMITRSQQGMAD